MDHAVSETEKGRRLQILLERQRQIQAASNQTLVGQTFDVLVDGGGKREGQWAGRTSSNRVVNFTSPQSGLLGHYVNTRIVSAGPNSLVGEHVI